MQLIVFIGAIYFVFAYPVTVSRRKFCLLSILSCTDIAITIETWSLGKFRHDWLTGTWLWGQFTAHFIVCNPITMRTGELRWHLISIQLSSTYLSLLTVLSYTHVLIWANTFNVSKLRSFSGTRASLCTTHFVWFDPVTVGSFELSVFTIISLAHVVIQANTSNIAKVAYFGFTWTLWWWRSSLNRFGVNFITAHNIQTDPVAIIGTDWNIFSVRLGQIANSGFASGKQFSLWSPSRKWRHPGVWSLSP